MNYEVMLKKLSKGTLITLLVIATSIIVSFVISAGKDYVKDKEVCAADRAQLNKDVFVLKEAIPRIEKKIDMIIKLHLVEKEGVKK
jgi:hypothetical protein